MPWEFRHRTTHLTNWYANCFLLKNSYSPGIPFWTNNIISCFGMILLVWDFFDVRKLRLNCETFIFAPFYFSIICGAFHTHSHNIYNIYLQKLFIFQSNIFLMLNLIKKKWMANISLQHSCKQWSMIME